MNLKQRIQAILNAAVQLERDHSEVSNADPSNDDDNVQDCLADAIDALRDCLNYMQFASQLAETNPQGQQLLLLVRHMQPGESFSPDELDCKEIAMAVLDRCRDFGYSACEYVLHDATGVKGHAILNMDHSVLLRSIVG